ncbi:TetR/AcrR family transcriptional regulator [Nocardioides sp. SYSU D00038]|uniref:TetR/AcrR family transcriptional regulator n=1 Tax=Nocardioides sp. SYSU D00038 TaxID=2812554 RepID=UPI001967AA5D|nr:TetR family transcriptional regulator [Nocardioides sp. SYSU D00038]
MTPARRHDPQRKQRIVEAAVGVIAQHGLVGTTHRRVAAAADVPLGSVTYHFESLEDLCRQAFEWHADRMWRSYAAHVEGVVDRPGLVDALTALVCGDAGADADDWAVAYELYLAALRRPALRAVTERWMAASRSVLERVVDPITARGVDALVEGLVMHRVLALEPMPESTVRAAIARAVDP